jgi:hypothetical protein
MTSLDASSLKAWEDWADFGFKLVIVGVVGECAELFARWFERRTKKRLPKWLNRSLLPIESFFWIVLCIGLSMEYTGGVQSRRISDGKNAALELEAADAKDDAAKSTNDAAQARLETETIKAQIAWREISATQQDKFYRLLAEGFKGPVVVECSGDPEEVAFATQIANMLSSCGFVLPQTE